MSNNRRRGRTRSVFLHVALAGGLAGLSAGSSGQTPTPAGAALEQGFKDPPSSARPRVWWHWLNGNVTREGITLDLEWMKRVGIGGVQNFDANIGNIRAGQQETPQYVEKRIVYHSPEWKELQRHAAAECDRLGLEMTMHSSGGWSETGGPWVKPEEAMKKLVWSETHVVGPKRFSDALAAPPSVNGPFQDLPYRHPFRPPSAAESAAPPDPTYYGDSAVVAFREPEGETRMADAQPKLTRSGGDFDPAALYDGDLVRPVSLPLGERDERAWIQYEFAEPFSARAVTIAVSGTAMPIGMLEASTDGTSFTTLVSLPGPSGRGLPVRTYAFPETKARFYRIVFTSVPAGRFAASLGASSPRTMDVAEVALVPGARVNRWEEKAAFGLLLEYDSVPTPEVPPAAAILPTGVVDLTSKMGPDGRLDWQVPEGRWVILRMGYSLTGQKNNPAPPEATGYEVDKLNPAHVRSYLEQYLAPVKEAMGPLFGKSFQYLLMDSWEAGLQNWTEKMLEEFEARCGYDPKPYLPALTGRIVGSADISERFLWDFRRTIADMLADYHYELPAGLLHDRGLKLYAEAAGTGSPMFQDALQNKGRVDIPMGEFWTLLPGEGHRASHVMDVHEAASAAHIYGKPLVATESFTSFVPGWNDPPSALKWVGDHFMAMGVNRFVIHTSVHQPFVDRKPGITLGPFGQHYTRNNTWAEPSKAWISYLTRASYMLQQGLFVGDLAYYYGEGAPATVYKGPQTIPSPAPPEGYAYDYLNTEVLLTRMSVKDGRLTLPDGMSYRVLVLPDGLDRLTLPVVRKLRDLVAAGATVVGPRPQGSPSLVGYPGADDEIRALANAVWGACDGRTVTEHAYGKGKVYWGRALAEVLGAQKTPPDVEYTRPHFDTTVDWIHRRTSEADIYFVANQKERTEDVDVGFRIGGKAAELWHPETGEIEPASYHIEDERTTVPLRLGPQESVFVVFREPAAAPSRALPRAVSTRIATVEGAWDVRFPPDEGAPPRIRLDHLVSWTESTDPGVRYFSGTATYTKDIEAPRDWFRSGARLVLDLGRVKEIAEVVVNGTPLGIAWHSPFRVDVTGALKPGTNHVEVKVTNLWVNRLVGDEQPGTDKRYTFSSFRPYTKDSPLLESGLLGPVTLESVVRK
jgi:hypothetical protein